MRLERESRGSNDYAIIHVVKDMGNQADDINFDQVDDCQMFQQEYMKSSRDNNEMESNL